MKSIETVGSVAEINFAAWSAAGVECLLLDVEGTLVPYSSTEVDPAIQESITHARIAGIAVVGLVSNKADHGFLQEVGEQVAADGIFMPSTRAERKPSPAMLYRAMSELGDYTSSQAGMVGDKYSADVKAGIRAGVAQIAWTRRLGSSDHPGDRLVRRPYEAMRFRPALWVAGRRVPGRVE